MGFDHPKTLMPLTFRVGFTDVEVGTAVQQVLIGTN